MIYWSSVCIYQLIKKINCAHCRKVFPSVSFSTFLFSNLLHNKFLMQTKERKKWKEIKAMKKELNLWCLPGVVQKM